MEVMAIMDLLLLLKVVSQATVVDTVKSNDSFI
jgi:hypothetical protein